MTPPIPLDQFDPDAFDPGLHRLTLLPDQTPPALPPLPVLLWRGGQPGPRLLVTAGVHGDEYEGPLALWQLADTLAPDGLRGSMLALPWCNPWAAAAATRATPAGIDGLNLARVFPGDPAGRPTERLAHALIGLIIRLYGSEDLLVDLHAGGVELQFAPMVGYRDIPGAGRARSQAAARIFGLDRIWQMAPHRGTLTDAAARLGIACIGAEMPGMGGATAADVLAYVRGLQNLLHFQQMLTGAPPASSQAQAQTTTNVTATQDGFLITERRPGDQVQDGDQLGQVVDELGAVVETIVAPHAGEIWAVRHLRRVAADGIVAVVARPAGGAGPVLAA